MSKYFDCNAFDDEAVLPDGTFNYELVSHHLIAYMADNHYPTDAMQECYKRLEEIMHWRSPKKQAVG